MGQGPGRRPDRHVWQAVRVDWDRMGGNAMSIDASGGSPVHSSAADATSVSTAGMCAASLVYRSEYKYYDFGPQHPLRPERLIAAQSLFAAAGLCPSEDELIRAPPASPDELRLTHSEQYVEAVKRIDLFADDPQFAHEAEPWGLGPGDSPAFVGMPDCDCHTAASLRSRGYALGCTTFRLGLLLSGAVAARLPKMLGTVQSTMCIGQRGLLLWA